MQVFRDEGIEQLQPTRRQMSQVAQHIAERFRFVGKPDVQPSRQFVVRHEVELHGEETKEEVAVGRHGPDLAAGCAHRSRCGPACKG